MPDNNPFVDWDAEADTRLLGSLFPRLPAIPSFNNIPPPIIGKGFPLQPSPVYADRWGSYTSGDGEKVFFGKGEKTKHRDDISFVDETGIYKSLRPTVTATFSDYRIYKFKIKVYIQKDGALLLRAWQSTTAAPDELLSSCWGLLPKPCVPARDPGLGNCYQESSSKCIATKLVLRGISPFGIAQRSTIRSHISEQEMEIANKTM